jgi:Tfp pilus assembly protein PilF
MRLNRLSLATGLMALLVAAGCQSNGPKEPTQKEQAIRKWNNARATVLISLAKEQYSGGQFEKCRHTLDDALKLSPDNTQLHILSAKLSIEQGQLEAAERELKMVRSLAPNDAEAHYLSGVVYQRWQKPELALDLYRAAAERSPAELPYWMAQAEMLVALDRPADALALLQGKVDYFEHSGAIRDAVGQLLMQLGRPGEAASMLRQASILSEDDQAIRERFAMALYANHDYREAAEVLARLVQNEQFAKRGDLFLMMGECQLQTGRTREARYTFETASQLDAQSAPIWRALARAAFETGDLKRADLALAKSLRLDSTLPETHLLLGYVRLRQNRLKEAQTAFQKASTLDPKDTVSLCMIGYVLEKSGRGEEAAQYYGKALRMKPGDDMASRLLAGLDTRE